MKIFKHFTRLLITMVILGVIITGCSKQKVENSPQGVGYLTLSINPEVQIEYDQEGLVIQIIGKNEDGRKIVDSYNNYIWRNCNEVVEELITKIYEAGYFINEVEGTTRSIMIEIEAGSKIPSEDFLQKVLSSSEESISKLGLQSKVLKIDDDDRLDENGKTSEYISKQKAQEIVLAHAGKIIDEVYFEDLELDSNDGYAIYEFEFECSLKSYKYKIDAKTGKILHHEIEHHDYKHNYNYKYDDCDLNEYKHNYNYKYDDCDLNEYKHNYNCKYDDCDLNKYEHHDEYYNQRNHHNKYRH